MARSPAVGLAVLVVAVLPAAATAQPFTDISIGGSFGALSDSQRHNESRLTLAGSLLLGLDFAAQRGAVAYELDTGRYATAGDWSFLSHRLEALYRVELGADSRWLFLGVQGVLRRNGDAWSSADYDALGARLSLELRPRDGLAFRTGYRLDRRTFAELAALEQTEHDLFASLLANLPSRTTLIAEAHFGFKSYAGEPLSPEPSTGEASGDAPVTAGNGPDPPTPGPGPGGPTSPGGSPGGGAGPVTPGGGAGPGGMGPPVRPAPARPERPSDERARQLTLLARVAQSLGERTGLSLQATLRNAFGAVPPAVVTTPAGFFDDGVYDDPFASDLASLQLRLKHVFGSGAEIEGWGVRLGQDFNAAVALGADGLPLAGAPLREDDVWRVEISLHLPLFPARTGHWAVALELGGRYTRSESNDFFYSYTDRAAELGVSLRY